jgi:YVTN family beta-propeller protein
VIDTASNIVVATVAAGIEPFGVAITPDGTQAYVTNVVSNTVSVIATASNTVVAAVVVGALPTGIGVHRRRRPM